MQQFTLTPSTQAETGLQLQISRWHALVAFGALDNQLCIGAGARVLALGIQQSNDTFVPAGSTFVPGRSLMSMMGAAPEVGALYKPNGLPWRLGATLRAPVSARPVGAGEIVVDASGVERAGGYVIPANIVQPWEAEVGVALQAGPRPLNPAWQDPHEQEAPARFTIARARSERAEQLRREEARMARLPEVQRNAALASLAAGETRLREAEDAWLDAEVERLEKRRRARYANWPREKIMLVSSFLVSGPTRGALDVASFLDQRVEPFGHRVTVTPRVGIEAEPLHDLVRGRIGTYLEPSRIEGGTARQHLTCGADIKLFAFDAWGLFSETMWRLSFSADLAPRYTNWGVGLGAWH